MMSSSRAVKSSCDGNPLHELASRLGCAGPCRGRAGIGVEVAGREVGGSRLRERRLDVAADVTDVRLAPRVETAAGRWIERARDLATQDDLLPLALHGGVGGGDRRDQRLAVGMQR